ncbi:MAG: TonB-dependent receptor [Myxococcota bacterium]|nr:TonB-dependent receptor [Myxococcota bacterium]
MKGMFRIFACITLYACVVPRALGQTHSSTSATDKIEIDGKSIVESFDRLESSTFFSNDEIRREDVQGRSLADLLERVAGTRATNFGGPLLSKAIQIRGGSAAQTEVIIAGVPQRTPFAMGIDLSLLTLNHIEEIKVVRGGTTLGSAMGGAVYASSRTTDSVPGASFTIRYGSLDRTDLEAIVRAGNLVVSTAYRRSLGNFEFDSKLSGLPTQRKIRSNNDAQTGQLLMSGQHKFLGGIFGHNLTVGIRESGVAGFETQPTEFTRDFRGQTQLRTFWKNDKTRLSSFFHGMLIDYSKSDTGEKLSETMFHSYGLDGSTRVQVGSHTITPEVFISRISSDSTEHGIRARVESWMKLQDEFTFINVDWLAQIKTYWDSDFGFQLQPSMGGTLYLSDTWLWRSSLGRAFRAPTLDELYHPTQNGYSGNPSLQPESSWEIETGLRWLWARNAQVDFVGYFRQMDDLILALNRNAFEIRPENTDEASITGVEIESSYGLPTKFVELALFASAAFMWTRSEVTGEPLPTRPTLSGYFEARLKAPQAALNAFELYSSWRGLSSTTTNLQGTLEMPSYHRVDAGATYEIFPGAMFSLSVTNILDDKGLMTVNKLPLPGRQFLASLRVSDLAQP